MIIMLNGSFGVGKTTVAGLLRRAIPGSRIYDPEWAGSVLMRLPAWVALQGRGTDDFQDIALWRRSVVAGTRLWRLFAAGPVIIPMAFSRRDYFDQAVGGLRRLDPALRIFCLQASQPTLHARLLGRGTVLEGPGAAWITRRVAECVTAHQDAHFGDPVETEGRPPQAIADDIVRRLRQTSA